MSGYDDWLFTQAERYFEDDEDTGEWREVESEPDWNMPSEEEKDENRRASEQLPPSEALLEMMHLTRQEYDALNQQQEENAR